MAFFCFFARERPRAIHSLTKNTSAPCTLSYTMVLIPVGRQFVKRQLPTDPLAVPTIEGFNGAATLSSGADPTAISLVANPSATFHGNGISAPPLAPTLSSPPTVTETTVPPPGEAPEAQGAASKSISLSTVIGSCVGAFVGASIFILIALWWYRRYNSNLKTRARILKENKRSLPNNPSSHRGKSDEEDKWESQYQTKEADNINSMEKLTMFKKSTPSVKTTYTHHDPPSPDAYPQSFTQFREELVYSDTDANGRPFLGRVDAGPPISWASENAPSDSFLTLNSGGRLSSGAMSPSINMAIPTPAATSAPRGEAAEVVSVVEAQSVVIINPFESEVESKKNPTNPFFSAQDYGPTHTRSRSSSLAHSIKRIDKGKGKAIDPFDDEDNVVPSLPQLQDHAGSDSSVSVSNDRAIQSLIAALDIPEAEIQERLRVASMQLSVVSATSVYTEGDVEEVARRFPLPPSSESSHATAKLT